MTEGEQPPEQTPLTSLPREKGDTGIFPPMFKRKSSSVNWENVAKLSIVPTIIIGGVLAYASFAKSCKRPEPVPMVSQSEYSQLQGDYGKLQKEDSALRESFNLLLSSNTVLAKRAGDLESQLAGQKPKTVYLNALPMCDEKFRDYVGFSHPESFDKFSFRTREDARRKSGKRDMEWADWVKDCMTRYSQGLILDEVLSGNVWSKDDRKRFDSRRMQISYGYGILNKKTGKGTAMVELKPEQVERIMPYFNK